MRCTKKGKKLDRVWRGVCRTCDSEFEATEKEVTTHGATESDMRDHSRWQHRDCPECGQKAGFNAVILYPIT